MPKNCQYIIIIMQAGFTSCVARIIKKNLHQILKICNVKNNFVKHILFEYCLLRGLVGFLMDRKPIFYKDVKSKQKYDL